MLWGRGTNRFLLDGFPLSLAAAKRFEQDITPVSFILYLEGEGEMTPEDEEVDKIVKYYTPIGKVRKLSGCATKLATAEDVYAEVRKFFACKFLYLLGPPGAPVAKVA